MKENNIVIRFIQLNTVALDDLFVKCMTSQAAGIALEYFATYWIKSIPLDIINLSIFMLEHSQNSSAFWKVCG